MSEKYRPARTSSSRDMPPKRKGKRSRDAVLQDVDGRSMEKALPSNDAAHVGGVGTSPAKRARNDLESRGTTSPRNGVIKEIVVKNFMCHQLLRVNLNPRVNVISGQGGSGKSAIVAALQTCLGATARETGRSDSLQKLVRRHQTKPAYAIVTLHNPKGDLAYRHEVYGDTITIERKIMPSSSSYSLYTHDEWEKHRKNNEYKAKKFTPATGTVKLELASMLDWFSINVTNPCNVLDQQTAQTFITGSDEQKYKFFEDATELKVLDEKAYEAKKRERYESLRASVCKNISHMFNQVLSLQQHHGHVNFDHTKKELKMNVELGEKGALVKDMKSLSGGERSTVTLSLLMALLKCVNSPFTVLDEVLVAIRQSINAGVKMAELPGSRQFIFITQHRLCCAAVQRTDTVNLINIDRECPRPSPKISSSTS